MISVRADEGSKRSHGGEQARVLYEGQMIDGQQEALGVWHQCRLAPWLAPRRLAAARTCLDAGEAEKAAVRAADALLQAWHGGHGCAAPASPRETIQ